MEEDNKEVPETTEETSLHAKGGLLLLGGSFWCCIGISWEEGSNESSDDLNVKEVKVSCSAQGIQHC